MAFKLLALWIVLIKWCIGDNIIEEEFFFDDFGAWILCRKIVDGVNGNFGLGYNFKVKYELTNIGTQAANNIKIEDTWDWKYVERYGDPTDSKNIVFEQKTLQPKETIIFTYKLTPITIGITLPLRANISYYVGDNKDDYILINGHSSNWITSNNDKNMNNNKLIIFSSSMYSRSISSTVMYWILFFIFSIISIIYPLCEYESN
eukprot:103572_1